MELVDSPRDSSSFSGTHLNKVINVSSSAYYSTYYGHTASDLAVIELALRRRSPRGGLGEGLETPSLDSQRARSIVWLLGDSSLDNKVWLSTSSEESAQALNGFEHVLAPPTMRQDVEYHVNALLMERKLNTKYACINTAVEATSLNDRAFGRLLEQDAFAARHLQPQDTLVVSLGGNDVALAPLLCTAINMLGLVFCTARQPCMATATTCVPNIYPFVGDCGCLLCGVPGCLVATPLAWPPFFGYFVDLFKNRIEAYVQRIIDRAPNKPRRVVVCTIYYPAEARQPSWAQAALSALRYDVDPKRLQRAIRAIFTHATSKIRLRGVPQVVPLPLYEALNPLDADDYVARVEPSAKGGRKIAEAILEACGMGAPNMQQPHDNTMQRWQKL